jgi:DNA-binding HxlR family transcriptional regulator
MESHPCGDADRQPYHRTLSLLHEKWVLFIVDALLDGPIGFNEMTRRAAINTTTLSQRLDLLEQHGIVTRTVHSTIPPRTSYELTERGRALRGVLEAIARWTEAYPHDPSVMGDCEPTAPESRQSRPTK